MEEADHFGVDEGSLLAMKMYDQKAFTSLNPLQSVKLSSAGAHSEESHEEVVDRKVLPKEIGKDVEDAGQEKRGSQGYEAASP